MHAASSPAIPNSSPHPPTTLARPPTPQMHARWLARSGQPIHLREFDVGHMDLTFAVKPELRDHVLRRLLRPL